MQQFQGFIDRKHRKAIKELHTISSILKMAGFKIKNFFENKLDPYLFCLSNADTPFGGIRIYKIDDTMAFRTQNEENSHPFGAAFEINVDKIFEDFVDDDTDESKIGEKMAESIADSIRFFFKKNADLYRPVYNMSTGLRPDVATPPVSPVDNFRTNGPWP